MPAAATAPAPAKPPAPKAETPVPKAEPKVTLDEAMKNLAFVRRTHVADAIKIYRAHAMAIADGKSLAEAEYAALSHAVQTLGLTADDLRADIQAVVAHRGQIAAMADAQATIAKLTAEEKTWVTKEEDAKKMLLEVRQNRGRLHAAGLMVGQTHGAVHAIVGDCPRLLGSFETAVEAVLAPKGTGLYVPKVIRNEPNTDAGGTVGHFPGPFLGTLG